MTGFGGTGLITVEAHFLRFFWNRHCVKQSDPSDPPLRETVGSFSSITVLTLVVLEELFRVIAGNYAKPNTFISHSRIQIQSSQGDGKNLPE